MRINIKKLNKRATIPTYGSDYSAGVDLYALIDEGGSLDIPPHSTVKVGTGIAMEIPIGNFGGIFARSGLAAKQSLRPANCVGVIDSDYRGEILIALHNDSDETRTIHDGDRIAQLIIMPFLPIRLNEVDSLADTDRGAGGFGSTGK